MDKQVNMTFRLARIERGLSQEELAAEVEVSRQTIGLIERGKYNPSIRLCIRLAKVLNRTLDQLFWEETKHE
jgi:putative transcriptional regulator